MISASLESGRTPGTTLTSPGLLTYGPASMETSKNPEEGMPLSFKQGVVQEFTMERTVTVVHHLLLLNLFAKVSFDFID